MAGSLFNTGESVESLNHENQEIGECDSLRKSTRFFNPSGSFYRCISLLTLSLSIGIGGCSEEPPEVEEKEEVAADAAVPFDLGTTPSMVIPPDRLLQVLPSIPKGISGAPGTHVGELLKDPKIKKDPRSSRILVKKTKEGPFSDVRYLLDETGTTVTAIHARFNEAYSVRDREEVVLDYAQTKLGVGTKFDSPIYSGHRWTRTQYKIELRREVNLGWLELVFDARGAIDPIGVHTKSSQ